jgi:hypothetical protein
MPYSSISKIIYQGYLQIGFDLGEWLAIGKRCVGRCYFTNGHQLADGPLQS